MIIPLLIALLFLCILLLNHRINKTRGLAVPSDELRKWASAQRDAFRALGYDFDFETRELVKRGMPYTDHDGFLTRCNPTFQVPQNKTASTKKKARK